VDDQLVIDEDIWKSTIRPDSTIRIVRAPATKSSSKVVYRMALPHTPPPELTYDAYESTLSEEQITSATFTSRDMVVIPQRSIPATIDKYWDTVTKCTRDTWSFAGSLEVVHFGKAERERSVRVCKGGVLDGTLELPEAWSSSYYLVHETLWAHGTSTFDIRYPNFAHATNFARLFAGFGQSYVEGALIRKLSVFSSSQEAIRHQYLEAQRGVSTVANCIVLRDISKADFTHLKSMCDKFGKLCRQSEDEKITVVF
jgi:hypothetical protein